MIVCIAEKPSVAREIAQVLKANNKSDGFFEGNGYAVTYTFGHFCTLHDPKDYKPYWKSWDLNNLPMLPEKFETKIVADQGIQKQFNIIKSLFEKATLVINCGDAGQEGLRAGRHGRAGPGRAPGLGARGRPALPTCR